MKPRTAAIGIGVLTLVALGLLAWVLKAAGSSGGSRPVIPVDSGYPFWGKPATLKGGAKPTLATLVKP